MDKDKVIERGYSISRAVRMTRACLAAGKNVFWTGQPGIGKTEAISEMARNLRASDIFVDQAKSGDSAVPVRFQGCNATTMESVDVRGIPSTSDGMTTWCAPAMIPRGDEAAVMFIDEFPQAEEQTQIALGRLIDRELDGCNVSSRCGFICAGNRITDESGAKFIPQHIRNRFSWIPVLMNNKEWLEWALANLVRVEIIEFIEKNPSFLNMFHPKSDAMAYATPRSITNLSRILDYSAREDWFDIAECTVGPAWAGAFDQQLTWFNECVDPLEFLKDPVGNSLPDGMPFIRVLVNSCVTLVSQDVNLLEPTLVLLDRVIDTPSADFAVGAMKAINTLHAKGKISKGYLQTSVGAKLSKKCVVKGLTG